MKILALTCGDEGVASSRLRSYYPFSEVDKSSFSFSRTLNFSTFFSANIIHFQKTLHPEMFLLGLIARILGKKTIFDFDDQPHSFGGALAINLNILLASLVVVDTDGKRQFWKKKYFFKKIAVVPDALDVDNKIDLNVAPKIELVGKKRLVWIGHPDNVHSIESLIKEINASQELFSLSIITAQKAIDELSKKYQNVEFIPWSKDILFLYPSRYQFMILNHDAGDDASLKSENKMVLSLAAGIIPIVSNTPAYAALAKVVGSEKFMFKKLDQVVEIINNTSHSDCDFLISAKQYVIKHFSHKNVFNILMSQILD